MSNVWPNFTNLLTEGNETLKIQYANKGFVYDQNNNEYLDAISGIWNVSLGYSRRDIIDKIYEDMKRLPTTSLFGRSYVLIEDYTKKLLTFAPDFSRVFYSTGGSDAVETAIKLSRLHNFNKGYKEKNKIGHFRMSYHGVSMGALQVMGEEPNKIGFSVDVSNSFTLPIPDFDDYSYEEIFEIIKSEDVSHIASIILEPIIGSGGIIPFQKEFLQKLRNFTKENDILLIFDEVVTGFGRTGSMFAYQKKEVIPDMLVLAKSLTAGYAPLGALLISENIESTFVDKEYKFLHGYTYGGSVVGISAANKVLDIYKEENITNKVIEHSEKLFKFLYQLKVNYPYIIKEIRGEGLMVGIEIYSDSNSVYEISELYKIVNKHKLISRAAYNNTLVLIPLLSQDTDYILTLQNKLESIFEEYSNKE